VELVLAITAESARTESVALLRLTWTALLTLVQAVAVVASEMVELALLVL